MKFQSNVVLRRVQKRKDQAGSIALLSSHRHRDSLRSIIHLLANHRCTRSVKIVACLSPLHNPRRSIDVRVNEPTSEQGGAWFVFRYMEGTWNHRTGVIPESRTRERLQTLTAFATQDVIYATRLL